MSENYIGQKFGFLTVLQETRDDKNKKAYLCKCDCGNTRIVQLAYLKNGRAKNCSMQCPLIKRGKNEIGNKYGRLTVVEPAGKIGKNLAWKCKCDCGNETIVAGTYLRRGVSRSCGCLQKEKASESLIDLTGKKFGFLIVLKRDETKPKGHGKPVFWKCECECGNIVSVEGARLKSGHTKSCGCYNPQSSNFIDETGNKYGKLTVIEEFGRDKDGRVLWRCQCDCGNEKIALGKSLRAGLVQSCGCLQSRGEQKVNFILTKLNISFIPQYHIKDLKSKKNYPLYFDFYLPDYNLVIEYQGEQHYAPLNRWHFTEDNFLELKERDNLKKEYCKKNNIKFIEIPYTDYDKLDEEYIKEVL